MQTGAKNKTNTVLLHNISPERRHECPLKHKGMLALKPINGHLNGRGILLVVVPSCRLREGLHTPPVTPPDLHPLC